MQPEQCTVDPAIADDVAQYRAAREYVERGGAGARHQRRRGVLRLPGVAPRTGAATRWLRGAGESRAQPARAGDRPAGREPDGGAGPPRRGHGCRHGPREPRDGTGTVLDGVGRAVPRGDGPSGQLRRRSAPGRHATAIGPGRAEDRRAAAGPGRADRPSTAAAWRGTRSCAGSPGSGKTYSLGVLLEQVLAETRLRVVVLDPNSDYVGLGDLRPDADPPPARGTPTYRPRSRSGATRPDAAEVASTRCGCGSATCSRRPRRRCWGSTRCATATSTPCSWSCCADDRRTAPC